MSKETAICIIYLILHTGLTLTVIYMLAGLYRLMAKIADNAASQANSAAGSAMDEIEADLRRYKPTAASVRANKMRRREREESTK